MQTIKLKFTRIEAPEFEKKGFITLKIHYKSDGEEKSIEKQYGYVKEDPQAFAENIIAEVKSKCRKNAKPDPTEDGILAGYVHVQLQEERDDLTAERIANALKQLKDKMRNLRTTASSENYMNKYVEVRGIVLEL